MNPENRPAEVVQRQTIYVLWESDADWIEGMIEPRYRDTFWELLMSRQIEYPNSCTASGSRSGRKQDF